MKGFSQMVCVVAIGLGAGVLSAGHYLEPPMAEMTPADLQCFWSGNDDVHIAASVLRGFRYVLADHRRAGARDSSGQFFGFPAADVLCVAG